MRSFFYFPFLMALFPACATLPKSESLMPISIPFSYLEDSFLVVPISLNGGKPGKFIFDTGIGLNLVSKSLCKQLGCKETGTFTGKRMSGQAITIPTGTIPSMKLGDLELKDAAIGIWDIEQLMPNSGIDGFLSLGFFREHAVTVDYQNQRLVLETKDSLGEILKQGTAVPIKLDAQGESLGVFMPIVLPTGELISVEVDTGSQALILNEKHMKALGIDANDSSVRKKEGKDETGHSYFRYFTKLKGDVHLPKDKNISVTGISVMFQKIIYEGLVGHDFLSQFAVTYDIPNLRMIFRKRGGKP